MEWSIIVLDANGRPPKNLDMYSRRISKPIWLLKGVGRGLSTSESPGVQSTMLTMDSECHYRTVTVYAAYLLKRRPLPCFMPVQICTVANKSSVVPRWLNATSKLQGGNKC